MPASLPAERAPNVACPWRDHEVPKFAVTCGLCSAAKPTGRRIGDPLARPAASWGCDAPALPSRLALPADLELSEVEAQSVETRHAAGRAAYVIVGSHQGTVAR